MESISYSKFGCVITWNIENYSCLKDGCLSPVFNSDTIQRTQWQLEIEKCDWDSFGLKLKRCDKISSNIYVSYLCYLTPDHLLKRKFSGLKIYKNDMFRFSDNLLCIPSQSLSDIPKQITIHYHLRVITDNNFVTNQYRFRTVVEAEQRRIKHILPNISTLINTSKSIVKLFVPLSSTSDKPGPFKITLNALNLNGNENFNIEFNRHTGNKCTEFFLRCKLSVFGVSKVTADKGCMFSKGRNKWHFPKLVSFNYLKQNSAENTLFDFDLLISEQKTMTWLEDFIAVPNHPPKMAAQTLEKEKESLKDDLMCLYLERKCPDVEICVEGQIFPSHKAILSARSPVFMAMFKNDMQEKEKNIIVISDLEFETVDRMLWFIYSEILQVQEWDEVVKLYNASDKYQIMTLKSKCSSILIEQLTPKNICEALQLADMHSDSDFLNAVQDFIVANDEKVLQSDEWKEFMNSNSKTACQTMHKVWLHRSNHL